MSLNPSVIATSQMSPDAADARLNASEQPEKMSSPCAHPPFHEPKMSSICHELPENQTLNPPGSQHATPVDPVDAAAADLLKGAVEDGPGEDWEAVQNKV